jgi:hypothetical protein
MQSCKYIWTSRLGYLDLRRLIYVFYGVVTNGWIYIHTMGDVCFAVLAYLVVRSTLKLSPAKATPGKRPEVEQPLWVAQAHPGIR